MGKSPTAYHGHERSRHHNYSRNSQSRNRSSENQGFAPANYIYPPDRFLRQLPPYRRGAQYTGHGSSQRYFKGRSFYSQPPASTRGRSPLVQKRLASQRKHLRRDMHPQGEPETASKSNEQSADVNREENEAALQGQQVAEDPSHATVQASAPQTRSSTKAQHSKADECTVTEKYEMDDGDGKGQASNLQTRSTTKTQSKTEEVSALDKHEVEDGDGKITRNTRANSRARNDDKGCSTPVEVQSTEEKITVHNTRSAAKARLDTSDEAEHQEEVGHIVKTKKLRKESKTSGQEIEVDTESTHKHEVECVVETEKKFSDSPLDKLNNDVTVAVSQDTIQNANLTGSTEESLMRNGSEASVSPTIKWPMDNNAPILVLPELEIPLEKSKEVSPDKGNTTATSEVEFRDTPRRSSRRGSSNLKVEKEEFRVSHKTQHRSYSRTPVQFQEEASLQERADISVASIRAISCRRPIRGSPTVATTSDSPHKHKVIRRYAQITNKSSEENLLSSNLDVSSDKSVDVTAESDESSVLREATGKRKAPVPEAPQEHKKKCISKSEENTLIFSGVSSPLQLLAQKQEPVSSSTPLKVVECCETVHMELTEENVTDESIGYEKAESYVTDESIGYEKGEDIVNEQSLTFEKETFASQSVSEQTARKWCSVM